MGIYLNPGNEMFMEASRSEIYVDKTLLLKYTNSLLCTREKYLAVSRPRRFGKTTTLDMLAAYYGSSCESRELFAGFQIAKEDTFEANLGKYHVIQLDMKEFVSQTSSVDEMLSMISKEVMYDFEEEFPDVRFREPSSLLRSIKDVYAKKRAPFVFLIDEWDAVFRVDNIKNNESEQRKYLDFLRNMLKDKPYVALAYMTGILPVKKYGEHSALNMFAEYSMTEAIPISEYTGFTEKEVQGLCEEYGINYQDMQSWYDGYLVDGFEIYNPRSVVQACMKKAFQNYWTKTETYEALKVYIDMNIDGLRDKVIRMIASEHVPVNTLKFSNDMVTFRSADDVLTLLIHLGYLTYDSEKKECYIPNREVQQEFINSIEDGGWEEIMKAIRMSDELLTATLSKDAGQVEEMMEQVHQSETSIMAYNNENALSSVITIAYYTARRDYDLARELPGGKGFADVSFIPRRSSSLPAMIVELKVDKAADAAIDQIKRKEYVEGLKGYSGKVVLAGITYDRKTKKHHCQIEEIVKE